ncbi:MAG: hypothetical protein ABI175_00355 [Polyangiales bacterium]
MIMVPTLIATFTIVLQAHPSQLMRVSTIVGAVLAMTVPTLCELAGILPPSYLFEGGRMVVVPQMHALPGTGSLALLHLASVMMLTVPCLFIARLRTALNEAQTKLLVQAWLFRRLGDELTRG